MSYLPSQTSKAKKLREKFRKVKRKQFASIAAVLVVALVVVVGVVLLVLFVKSLFNKDTAVPIKAFVRQQPGTTLIQPAWNTLLQPAPWFALMGNGSLVIAGDTTGEDAGFPSLPVNYLSGYSRGGDGPNWRVDFAGPLTDLKLANNRIITFRQVLSEPPGVELAGYDLEDGSPVWSFAIELAVQGRIEIAGKVVCLTYQMPDGPRIAGYNAETGVKVWGLKVPLAANNPGIALTDQVYLEAKGGGGFLIYYVDRFFGLLDTSTGKLIRRYVGQGQVVDAAISWDESQVFLAERGLDENDYRLVTFPFRDGNPLAIHQYKADSKGILLSNGLYAILVFNEPLGENGKQGPGFVAGFTLEPSGPQFVHKLPPGYVDDAVAIPDVPGEFLLALNSSRTKSGEPRGQGKLLRVTFANQAMLETARFNQPVSWLVPFKDQCVVLLQGGRVVSYLDGLGVAVSIDKLRYPHLAPAKSQAADSLAVLSKQTSFAADQSGELMAVTIFE